MWDGCESQYQNPSIFNDLLLLQDFNFPEVECWCISFDEADICGYSDSFGVNSWLCLPKSTAVWSKVKPPVEDWHLQVQLLSEVEIGLFKVFQADLHKHRTPKSYIVTDTVKANLWHNKRIHRIALSTSKKPCADWFASDVKASHCALLSLFNLMFFPNKNNAVKVLDIQIKQFIWKTQSFCTLGGEEEGREKIWVTALYQKHYTQRTM